MNVTLRVRVIFHLCLQVINLSRNSIRSMKGLQSHKLLQEIDLEENQVSWTGGWGEGAKIHCLISTSTQTQNAPAELRGRYS